MVTWHDFGDAGADRLIVHAGPFRGPRTQLWEQIGHQNKCTYARREGGAPAAWKLCVFCDAKRRR